MWQHSKPAYSLGARGKIVLCTGFGVVFALIGPLQLLTVGLVGWLAVGAYYYGHLQKQPLAVKISVGCILVLVTWLG